MTAKQRLRSIFLCALLQVGVLFGMPMRPEQIRELMQSMHQPTIVRTNPEESPRDDEVRP